MEEYRILVINPGSTSTKVAIFQGLKCVISNSISYSTEDMAKYDSILAQKDMRVKSVEDWLKASSYSLSDFDAISARGGLLKPMPGGTYRITEAMVNDLSIGIQGQHASNLGGIIAYEMAKREDIPSFIVDPVAVDEISDVARISGLPEIKRKSLVHALNIKAVVRKVCQKRGLDYLNSSFVVAHMGGGISISPVRNGRILDCNNANEEGPFSPERTGSLPVGPLVKMAYSGKYTYDEMKKKITREGGLVAYLGTNDLREAQRRIDSGDKKAEFIVRAMAYQQSKEIGAMATVLGGRVDAVILTGGMAYCNLVTDYISEAVSFIAPVEIYAGEDEMMSLAQGALRVLSGNEEEKIYEKEACFEF